MAGKAFTDRHIRVFVSSTFRDMKAERDYLVKYTFPQLRKLCESRGVVWGEVDLRWGITDEEQAEGKVLPVCLEEIQRCRPYFIGLLGERYGWVPEAIPNDLVERQPWLRDHRERSITELEMQHGVLRQVAMQGQAFFYFRDPGYLDRLPAGATRGEFYSESSEAQAKLSALKQRLRHAQAEGICRVRESYPDPKTLGDWIIEDFTVLINQLYPEGSQLDPLDQDALDHKAFAQSRAKAYIERQEYFEHLDVHVASEGPPLVVLGDSGSGKSALLANWFLRYQSAHPDTLSIIHFIGTTPYSADWAAMLRRILSEFKRRFDIREEIPTDPAALRSTFANWLHRAAAKGKVVLVLDALNQLEDRDGAPDLVWLPPGIPANVRMILSTLPGHALDNLGKRGWPTVRVKPLQDNERRTLITQYLAQYTKSLSLARTTRIAGAPQTANPLYLRILLDELRLHGSHETLEPTIEWYLTAQSIPELYGKVLQRWEQDYEGDTDLVGEALSLLWAARRGLSESEWRDVLGTEGQPLPQATLAPFLLAVESGLVNRSGLITFAHDYLREAVQETYLPTSANQAAAHRRLADLFSKQMVTPRQIDELPWQLAETQEWHRLTTLLEGETFLRSACQIDQWDVRRLWVRIELESSYRMTEIYRRLWQCTEQSSNSEYLLLVANLLRLGGHPIEASQLYRVLISRNLESDSALGLIVLESALSGEFTVLWERGDLDEAAKVARLHERLCRRLNSNQMLAKAISNQAFIFSTQGRIEEAARLFRENEALCRQIGDYAGLQASLGNQAALSIDRGDLDEANRLCKEQEVLCRQLGDSDSLAMAVGNQARILRQLGDLDGAMKLFVEEELLCRKVGDLPGVASSLGSQGTILSQRGDLDGAMQLFKEQERLSREVDNLVRLATSLSNQAWILMNRGELDEAMRILKEQEQLCRESGYAMGLGASLGTQAWILQTQGDLDSATRLYKEQENLCRELGSLQDLTFSLGNQATILHGRGEINDAMRLYKEHEELCRLRKDLTGLQASLGNQARILYELGEQDRAMQLFAEQEQLCRELHDSSGLAHSLGGQAVILQVRGDLDGAMRLYKEQEWLCRELGDPNGLAISLVNQVGILAQQGQGQAGRGLAEEAYRLAMQHGLTALAQQFAPIVQELGGTINDPGR
jgi:tetratricopeptide (TPR) repeat protein